MSNRIEKYHYKMSKLFKLFFLFFLIALIGLQVNYNYDLILGLILKSMLLSVYVYIILKYILEESDMKFLNFHIVFLCH